MSTSTTDLPLRQLTRLRSEMGISAHVLTTVLLPDTPLIEVAAVARVCLPDWVDGQTIRRPTEPTRSITARTIALSVGNPREPTRRNVNLMVERGIFASSGEGISLAATPENEALFSRYYLTLHDLLIRTIADAAGTCDITLPIADTATFGIEDIIERALDMLMLPIDTHRPAGVTRTGFLIWAALTVVAVRPVTFDPELARRHANAIPPDELRIGVSLRRIAAMLTVPYATVWRQAQALNDAGLVTRLADDQWTVLTHNLMQGPVLNLGTPPSVLLLNKIRELAMLGLDPARAAEHYRIGRPAVAEFGLSQNG